MHRSGHLSGVLLCLVLANGAVAQEVCEPVVGSLASVEGTVEVERAGTFVWQPAALGQALCEARCGAGRAAEPRRAAAGQRRGPAARPEHHPAARPTSGPSRRSARSSQLVAGVIQSFSRSPRLLAINTPYLNATIEGTEFVVAAADGQSSVTVFEGVVRGRQPAGRGPARERRGRGRRGRRRRRCSASSCGRATPCSGRSTTRRSSPRSAATARPRRGPAAGARRGDAAAPIAGDLAGALRGARRACRRPSATPSTTSTGRRCCSRSAGSTRRAPRSTGRSRADPSSGLAYAQRAIIELVQNEQEQALADARSARSS